VVTAGGEVGACVGGAEVGGAEVGGGEVATTGGEVGGGEVATTVELQDWTQEVVPAVTQVFPLQQQELSVEQVLQVL